MVRGRSRQSRGRERAVKEKVREAARGQSKRKREGLEPWQVSGQTGSRRAVREHPRQSEGK